MIHTVPHSGKKGAFRRQVQSLDCTTEGSPSFMRKSVERVKKILHNAICHPGERGGRSDQAFKVVQAAELTRGLFCANPSRGFFRQSCCALDGLQWPYRTDLHCVNTVKEISICSPIDLKGSVDPLQLSMASDTFPWEQMSER